MTQDIVVANSTMKIVREKVDFIYGITSTPDGYTGSMSHNGSRFSAIVAILIKRGILLRSGHVNNPTYKWFNPNMSPTKTLYQSIAAEMVARERKSVMNSYKRKKKREEEEKRAAAIEKEKQEAKIAEPEPKAVEEPQPNPLAEYTIQQLWDELKSRGVCIEDGKLAIKTVQFFD